MAIEGKRKAPLRVFVISQQHYQNEVPYTVYPGISVTSDARRKMSKLKKPEI
jgi:hypothetical protein